MTRFLFTRLAGAIPTLFVIVTLSFFLVRAAPGGPFEGERSLPPEIAANLQRAYGLDQPIWVQYGHWLGDILRGDFGTSLRTGQPVGPAMIEALGRSLLLAGLAIGFMLLLAVPLGIVAAVRRGRAVDLAVGLVSYVGVSLPEFVTATLFALVLADGLHWLPATGYVPMTEHPLASLIHLVLPVLTVSVMMIAHVSRMVRSELVDVLHTDYIRAARLKGLPARTVLLKHALRNALLPAITIVALDVGYLLGGVIVVEEIFALPGIGRQLIVAIEARDLPAIQAGALIMAATYSLVNFAADMAYAWLDRRIQYD